MAKQTVSISTKAINNPGPDRTARVQRTRGTPAEIVNTVVIKQEKAR